MRTLLRYNAIAVAVLAAIGATTAAAATFNYHGSLTDGGQPANGRYDLQISVYGSEQGSVPLMPAVTLFGVDVHDGSFSTELDLGAAAQQGGWVGVAVRPAGSSTFAALSGRSKTEPEGTCPAAWLLDGNAGIASGSYLGTSDAVDLVLRTGGFAAAQFSAVGQAAILSPYGGAAVPGTGSTSVGYSNGAAGNYSFAGGFSGGTINEGSFVWGDRVGGAFTDHVANQFAVRADGGFIYNGSDVHFGGDDMVVYPRVNGDDDADFTLVSRNFHWGRIYVSDATGVLQVGAENGVHINNPVQIDGALDAKSIAVQGSASKSTAGAWKANSDARIKQDIQPVSDALDTLLKVHPVTFEYTDAYRADHAGVTDQRYYNVIAQQFAEVFPDAVSGSGEYLAGAPKTPQNEILQVDTYPAQIVTIAAVQELAQKNAALQSTVERLLARIEKLEAARGK